jgi:hypothetical protein
MCKPFFSLELTLTTVRKESSTVISSTKSWFSSRWRTCSDQYLQW